MRRLIESGALRGDRFLQVGLRGYWPPPETLDWMAELLVDDQRLVRTGFPSILGSEPDISVVGEASDGVEALQVVRATTPDVVLMDIRRRPDRSHGHSPADHSIDPR